MICAGKIDIQNHARDQSPFIKASSGRNISGKAGTRMELAFTELSCIDIARLVLVDLVKPLPEPSYWKVCQP